MAPHQAQFIQHSLAPVYNSQSRILILGSLPSIKSRAYGYNYGHPQNRFWAILEQLFQDPITHTTTPQLRRDFLLRHHLAIWDVIASCEIVGSNDASIKNVTPNDIGLILAHSPIRQIFTTGQTATKLYQRHLLPQTGRPAIGLPSTSPANAKLKLAELVKIYGQIKEWMEVPTPETPTEATPEKKAGPVPLIHQHHTTNQA